MIRTIAMSRKVKTIAKRGIRRIPKEEICPMMNEAKTAPIRLPNPPVTVTTKQSTRISPAMPGYVLMKGPAMTPPPQPARSRCP